MMKRTAIIMILAILASFVLPGSAFAQKDKIEGHWFNEEKDAKVEIYKAKNGKFYGKIVWLKNPQSNGKDRTDEKNPKAELRDKLLVGLVLLKGFAKSGDRLYDGGTIYDPKNGKTYSCKITWVDNQNLSIRGYIGVSLIGRTTSWTRTSL